MDEVILGHIHRAKALYDQYAADLRGDDEIRTLLNRYRESIEETGSAMRSEGVGAACTACARENPSGCCFVGIEEGYDDILLLVNLLLDCPLPDKRSQADSCFFVGSRGCRLSARYYFCLHYFCPLLKASLGDGRIGALQRQVGREVSVGWQLEQAVRFWLMTHGTG